MKATDLNQALSYVDDVYLMEADAPEKEILPMKTKKRILRILVAAALISLLPITAYALEQLHIHTLASGSSEWYKSYSDMDKAITKAGLEVEIPEQFENGFQFQRVEVGEVKGLDENGEKVLTYQELSVYYENARGQRLVLCVYPNMEEIPEAERSPDEQRTVGEIEMDYYLDHYQFVPADYELSEEEEKWSQQPGNYVSYGSEEVQATDIAFLQWTENDVRYFFMDLNATVGMDTLFAMAEGMIQQ